jgi:cell wall-associated NlpC family hydrolase
VVEFEQGRVSLPGLAMAATGGLLVWSAIFDPPAGPVGALRQLLQTGNAQVGLARSIADTAGVIAGQAGPSGQIGGENPLGDKSGGRVVAVAETYLGDPYVWAGESHKGVDCSGLVKVAYRDGAGIDLPHLATAQAARGRSVPADQVQAGDLVCWGSPFNVPHIAIAVNQETCIASWTYGVGVKYGPIHQKAVAGLGYPFFVRIL